MPERSAQLVLKTDLVGDVVRARVLHLHHHVRVQEVGLDHVGHKGRVLLLEHDGDDVVAYVSLPLQLGVKQMNGRGSSNRAECQRCSSATGPHPGTSAEQPARYTTHESGEFEAVMVSIRPFSKVVKKKTKKRTKTAHIHMSYCFFFCLVFGSGEGALKETSI